jgi:uncharacterized protein (TIGR03382 family)
MRSWAWFVIGVAAIGCGSNDLPAERLGTKATAIQGGENDTTSTFAVGVCNGQPGQCGGICSGALILPNVVATARHCISVAPQTIDCATNPSFGARKSGTLYITTNANMFGTTAGNPGWYAVRSLVYPTDDHICGNDIALLVLSTPVPANVAKPVTPGVQHLMWDRSLYTDTFTSIGYGNTSAGGGGSGTRRSRSLVDVLCIPGSDDLPCPTSVNEKEFIGGDGACSGDSGSSAFESRSVARREPVSFGVLSRGGESDDGNDCIGSAYTRFDAHRDLVLQAGKSASNNWQLYPEPSWTAYVPPIQPSSKGKPAADAGTGTSGPRSLGTECAKKDECASGICTDDGQGTLICSQACVEGSRMEGTCPDAYECRSSMCLPALPTPATPAAAATKDTSGCSTGGGPAGFWPLALALLLAVRRGRRS